MAGLIGASERDLRAVAQHERGIDPVAVVVVVVVAAVVPNEDKSLLALGPGDVHVDSVAVGGVGDDLGAVERLRAHHPAGVVALEERQVSRVVNVRRPDDAAQVFIVQNLMGILAVFVHLVILFVGEQRLGRRAASGRCPTATAL